MKSYRCFNLYLAIFTLIFLGNYAGLWGQCSCYDCPGDLPDEHTSAFTSEVIVFNSSNNTLGVNNTLEQICLDITHTFVGDMDITLTAPDGTSVILFADGNNDSSLGGSETSPFGNSGNDMDVCFVLPGSATNIFGSTGSLTCTDQSYSDPCNGVSPAACYTGDWGTYNEGCQYGSGIDSFNNGTGTVSGTWTISINDNAGGDVGTINDITLIFTNPPDSCIQVPPPPPALCGNTTTVAIPNNTGVPAQSVISNTGSTGNMGAGTSIVNVCVLIDHTWLGDLDVYLIEPDGTSIELSTDNGGSGDDYGDVAALTEVCFTPTASNSITTYIAGSTGDWLPEGDLSAFDGPANGDWTLSVYDDAGGDTGSIISWSIEFSNGDCSYVCAYTYNESGDFCSGDSYLWGGNIITSGGTYVDSFSVGGGCDSIVTLTLTEHTSVTVNNVASICPGDSMTVNGTDYHSSTGVYYDTLYSVYNCDSIIKTTLTVGSSNPYQGLYVAAPPNYQRVNPLTGAIEATINSAPMSPGWVNASFTIHEQGNKIYWLSDDIDLHSLDLTTGIEKSTPTDISGMTFFWSLRYYDGYIYTLTTAADNDKKLVRISAVSGLLDPGFPGIEINGTANNSISFSSAPVINPITGKYYIPLMYNTLLEFDITGGTGTVISLTGYLTTPGILNLLEINEYTGEMYALSGTTDVVSVTLTGPATADVALIKTLTTASGYSNPVSSFDADNGLYIFQAQTGCSTQNPLVAVDVSTGQEWCSPSPGSGAMQMEFLNCKPDAALRLSGD